MISARRSSTKRPGASAKLRGHDVEEFVGVVRRTVRVAMYRNWWMQQINLRRLHISMLPERAGRAC
jgi:hypothetical protein